MAETAKRSAPRNLSEPRLQKLSWEPEHAAASVAAVFDHVEAQTLEAIAWYMRRKAPRAALSQALRLAAIGFAAAGGLVPLIAATQLFPPVVTPGVGQLGYVCFALAAGCVAVDRFFGLSTGWMRYITSAFTLQHRLAEFQLEWSIVQSRLQGRPPTPAEIEQMLLRIKQFRAVVHQVIERETQSWVVEFQASLAELHKIAQSELSALKPGVIDVTIANGLAAEGPVEVLLDGAPREEIRGTRCQLGEVFPGQHKVTVRGTLDGAPTEASGVVIVPPNAVAALTLTLPRGAAAPGAPLAPTDA